MGSPSVFKLVLDEVQRGLREDLRFEAAAGELPLSITADAIQIRKLAPTNSGVPSRSDELMPGWLVCPGRRIPRDPSLGTNEEDEAAYTVLCQLIVKDYDRSEENLGTYLKWLEQAARYLNHLFARQHLTGDFGCVWDSFATEAMTADPKEWVLHQNFVGGVELQAIAWETRGITE